MAIRRKAKVLKPPTTAAKMAADRGPTQARLLSEGETAFAVLAVVGTWLDDAFDDVDDHPDSLALAVQA